VTTVAQTATGVALAMALVSSRAPAEASSPNSCDGVTLFTISKSENRNEVVYAVRVDENCFPMGTTPIFAYWRMHEHGPTVTEPLLGVEEPAYGIARERVMALGADGGTFEIALRAIPNRPIVVQTKRQDGSCHAWATVSIAGKEAILFNVYARLRWLGVEYLLLSGWTIDRTRVVHEKIQR